MKHICMFSSGVGSAVAAKRVAERYGTDDLYLLFADTNFEHEDNYRFLNEAAEWIGGELIIIDNDGKDIWDIFVETKYLGNSRVDPCSRVLKREAMRNYIDEHFDPEDSVCYIGFDWTEEHRMQKAWGHWEPWKVDYPLMWDQMYDKYQAIMYCLEEGIEPPWLTKNNFPHANCQGGCIKAGKKAFAHLLEKDPDAFATWENGEREVQVAIGKDVTILTEMVDKKKRPLSLQQLREDVKSGMRTFDTEDWGGCGCFI